MRAAASRVRLVLHTETPVWADPRLEAQRRMPLPQIVTAVSRYPQPKSSCELYVGARQCPGSTWIRLQLHQHACMLGAF